MGYRIRYNREKDKQFPMKQRRTWKKRLICLTVLMFLLGCVAEWHNGTVLKKLLIPGDPAKTEAALTEMIDDIRSGESFGDAINAFCKEILEHGESVG